MNVKDVQAHLEAGTEDRLLLMVAQQEKLMEKYHHIEAKLRLTQDCPVSLDDAAGQLLLKDFAWRCTEELAEALDALNEDHPDALLHAQEEIADALHFLLEFGILAGFDFTKLEAPGQLSETGSEPDDRLTALFLVNLSHWKPGPMEISLPEAEILIIRKLETMQTIQQLGMVCHTLKNKPWKQTQMLTDKDTFYARFRGTLEQFCSMAFYYDLDMGDLFQMYFRKAQVNEFRQRSEY